MQLFYMVYNLTTDVSQDGLVDICDVCNDWTDVAGLHTLISSSAHASAEQRLAVGDRFGHASMSVFSSWTEAVLFTRRIMTLSLCLEVIVI